MASTRKKGQSYRKLLSHFDGLDQDIFIGNTAIEKQENPFVKEGTGDRDFTVGTSGKKLVANETEVNFKNPGKMF